MMWIYMFMGTIAYPNRWNMHMLYHCLFIYLFQFNSDMSVKCVIIIILFFTLSIYSRGRFKNWWNDWKGLMLSLCSQGPAGCHVAEQHWNAAPAPKLADTND